MSKNIRHWTGHIILKGKSRNGNGGTETLLWCKWSKAGKIPLKNEGIGVEHLLSAGQKRLYKEIYGKFTEEKLIPVNIVSQKSDLKEMQGAQEKCWMIARTESKNSLTKSSRANNFNYGSKESQ